MANKKNLLVISATLILLVGIAVFLHGLRRKSEAPYGPPANGRRVLQELGLSSQQQMQMQQVRKAQDEKMFFIMGQLRNKRLEIEQAVNDPEKTRQDVDMIAAQLKEYQSRLTDLRLDGIYAIKEILTPEQFAKFQKLTAGRNPGRPEMPMRPPRRE